MGVFLNLFNRADPTCAACHSEPGSPRGEPGRGICIFQTIGDRA